MAGQYDEIEKLIQVGDLETAEKLLFDWIQNHPNDAHGWLLYGKCVTSSQQKQSCFNRVIALDPSNSEAHELLGQIERSTTLVPKTPGQPQRNSNNPSLLNALSPSGESQKSTSLLKKPYISNKNKARLPFVIYSFLHLIITILVGAGIVSIIAFFIPGVLNSEKTNGTIQFTWISNSSPSNANLELQNLSNIFLNPSHLDYHNVDTYEELNRLSTSITMNQSESKSIEFTGVSFVGQLLGGSVLQNGSGGQPLVVLMEVLFNDTRIPVVYYGPIDTFNYEDKLLIQGVYVKEANGVAAQHVEQIETKELAKPAEETLIMLRMALIVVLWGILCASIFIWKINIKRWWQANPILFSSTGVLLTLLLLSILLSGCNIDLSTTLNRDGSGMTNVLVYESRENLNFLRSAPGISGYLSAVIKQIKKSGAVFEQYIEGDQEVFFLQRYLNNYSSSTGNTYPLEGSWVYVQNYQEGGEDVLRFLGVIDTRTLYSNTDNLGSDVASALRDELSKIVMNYHLIIPGRLVYHNGKEEANRQVSWQIRMNDINYLVAETRFPIQNKNGLSSYSMGIWITLGILFSISTVFLIASIWVRPASTQVGRKA